MPAEVPAQWYLRVLDAIMDFVVVKDTRSRLIWANQAFCDYYKLSRKELENLIDADTSDPDDTAQYLKDDYQVISERRPLDIPHEPITDGNGNIRYFNTIKTPLVDEADNLLGIVCVARLLRDGVNEFERQRERWKAHLAELRTLVSAMPLAVGMFDPQMRFLAHSRAWHDLFAHSGPELTGQHYGDLFEATMPLAASAREAIETPRPVSLEARPLTRADGSQRIVNIELRPWFTPAGEVGGSIVLFQDITSLQRANQQLRQLNDELLQFNYRASHDLLAPLKSVLGYLNLCDEALEEQSLDDLRLFHDRMRHNVTQLATLVEDVLNLSRSDVLQAEIAELSLPALLQDIVDKHQDSIDAASLEVELRCEVASIRSERVRLQQILENLLANAIKYHDPAKDRRIIAVHAHLDAANVLVVTVRDNGIGFEESQREAIFELFRRGTSKRQGSGLGLYLVKKHLAHLRGQIEVLSCRDDTVFELRIPHRAAACNGAVSQ